VALGDLGSEDLPDPIDRGSLAFAASPHVVGRHRLDLGVFIESDRRFVCVSKRNGTPLAFAPPSGHFLERAGNAPPRGWFVLPSSLGVHLSLPSSVRLSGSARSEDLDTPPTATVHSRTTAEAIAPRAGAAKPPAHVPPSWFFHLDGFLRSQGPGILQPGAGHGVRCVRTRGHVDPDEPDPGEPWTPTAARCSLRRFDPRRQPCRITAASALLPFVPHRHRSTDGPTAAPLAAPSRERGASRRPRGAG
jgi:hypothetical protein